MPILFRPGLILEKIRGSRIAGYCAGNGRASRSSSSVIAALILACGMFAVSSGAAQAQSAGDPQACATLDDEARAFLDALILDMLDPASDFSHFQYLSQPEMQDVQALDAERRRSDWGNLCQYRDDNIAVLAGPAPKVVFMGDSITEFWSIGDPDLFSGGVINRGISGQTSSQMLVRFWQDVVSLKPELVHIMTGTNDLAENTGFVSDDAYKANIKAMVTLAKSHDIGVVLASIPPAGSFGWRPELEPPVRISVLNQWLEDYAAETGSTFVDYHSLLTEDGGSLSENFTHDGVHPHRTGYAQMHDAAQAAIEVARR